MDALSEALKTVHVTSAIFCNAELTAPWGIAAPSSREIGAVLGQEHQHLVNYHFVIEGRALVRMEGVGELRVTAGDLVIFPQGRAHAFSNGPAPRYIESGAAIRDALASNLDVIRWGGGGETTRFVCGFFGCERHAGKLLLAGLPPMLKIGVRSDAAGAWLESSIRHLVSEAASRRPGRMLLLSKMAEALFIESMRRYAEDLPPGETGWLAGARDPVVGAALALLHRKPCHPWTLAELATEVGASRSVVAERFSRCLGEPPLSYLARWRLQLAARLLQTSRKTVIEVASDVGYESEASFNRAFKREFGLPPARYRRSQAAAGARPAA